MAAIAPITINNGETTPVAKTFNVDGIQGALASYSDRSGGISLGYPNVSFSVRPPVKTAKTRNNKVTFKVVLPVLEVTSPSTATGIQPAPTLAYEMVFTGEFILPERSSLAERKNVLAFAKNLLSHAVATAAVHDLEPVY